MSGRAQPTHGADSPAALRTFTPPPEYATYRVLLGVDDGERMTYRLNAIGWRDAANRARDLANIQGYFDVIVLKTEEVE